MTTKVIQSTAVASNTRIMTTSTAASSDAAAAVAVSTVSQKQIPIVCPGHTRPLAELQFCSTTTATTTDESGTFVRLCVRSDSLSVSL